MFESEKQKGKTYKGAMADCIRASRISPPDEFRKSVDDELKAMSEFQKSMDARMQSMEEYLEAMDEYLATKDARMTAFMERIDAGEYHGKTDELFADAHVVFAPRQRERKTSDGQKRDLSRPVA
jgi:hypothetical protein